MNKENKFSSGIKANLEEVQSRIAAACPRSGRSLQEITLIAVSKTKPVSLLQEAYEYGCRHFGENKVQELTQKDEQLPRDIQWHMIGHLQRNKVKYVVGRACLIHGVDSLRLAEEINKESLKKNLISSILIEVNMAKEESKFGVAKEDALELIKEIAKLPAVQVRGLMTIAPYVEDPEKNRQYFAGLRYLSVDIMEKNIDNVSMDILSMGMTGDYEVAIEEGATCIRVGTGIFGERDYQLV